MLWIKLAAWIAGPAHVGPKPQCPTSSKCTTTTTTIVHITAAADAFTAADTTTTFATLTSSSNAVIVAFAAECKHRTQEFVRVSDRSQFHDAPLVFPAQAQRRQHLGQFLVQPGNDNTDMKQADRNPS